MGCCGNRIRAVKNALPTLNAVSAQRIAFEQGMKQEEVAKTDRRIQLCRSCVYFDSAKELCNRCGCMVVAKVGKAAESCPIHRW